MAQDVTGVRTGGGRGVKKVKPAKSDSWTLLYGTSFMAPASSSEGPEGPCVERPSFVRRVMSAACVSRIQGGATSLSEAVIRMPEHHDRGRTCLHSQIVSGALFY